MGSAYAALEQALAIVDTMLVAAAEGSWEQVAELDRQCQPLLRAGYPHDPHSQRLLQQLLERNAAVLALAGNARAGLGDALGNHVHAHRALKAYVGYAR